jgi:hypothetical protein
MKYTTLILSIAILASCTAPKKAQEEEKAEKTTRVSSNGITLYKAPASPDFPKASLKQNQLKVSRDGDSSALDYEFEVTNYELGVQTSDAATRGIANSGKGQHIHFIVNNGPYQAHYMPGISNKLPDGYYTVLAFLSRSYHESVKGKNAYFIENRNIGSVEDANVDLAAPHLFYSRPKGSYAGADTKKLMLDFYLINCELSQNGYNVKATINGEEFLIDEWAPYYIEGLPMGEVKIKLELLDPSGELVQSPFNPVKRTVTLSE